MALDKNTEHLRMALNTVGVGVNHGTTDLILMIQKVVNRKKGAFNLEDAVKIEAEWKAKWDKIRAEEAS